MYVNSNNSIAYWLHLYRRLLPEGIGKNVSPHTTGETRATLEAAIQKYATKQPCTRVGVTGQIPLEKVLNGLLIGSEFETEREILQSGDQLVLTDFSVKELREFYDVERLAYELWRAGAMLRIVGKGAPIIVDNSSPDIVYDDRSDELDSLVKMYDSRIGILDYTLSSTGLVNKFSITDDNPLSMVILPTYNIGLISLNEFKNVFSALGLNISSLSMNMVPNFIWFPFSLGQFRNTHMPFAKAFRDKHKVDLDSVLLIIAALCFRVMFGCMSIWGRVVGSSPAFVIAAAQNCRPNRQQAFCPGPAPAHT